MVVLFLVVHVTGTPDIVTIMRPLERQRVSVNTILRARTVNSACHYITTENGRLEPHWEHPMNVKVSNILSCLV